MIAAAIAAVPLIAVSVYAVSANQRHPVDYQYVGQGVNGTPTGRAEVYQESGPVTVYLDLRNSGTETWRNSGAHPFRLATSRARDRTSPFLTPDWISPTRPATFSRKMQNGTPVPASSIAPGEIARFTFKLKANAPTGTYREYFNPVLEGRFHLARDVGIYWEVVSKPGEAPASTPTPTPAATPSSPLFRSDFESGDFDDWYLQSLSYRASVVDTPAAFRGQYAARFEVREGDEEPDTGDERSEVSGPTFEEGEDLYVRDAIYVPDETMLQGYWQIIQQLHEEDWDGSPGIAVFLGSDPAFRIGSGDSDVTYWESDTITYDRWYDLVYRVKLSQDPEVGFVEVWLDGERQTLDNGQQRMYGQTIQTGSTYLKAGIYRSRSHTGTSIIYHDHILVGRSLGSVMVD